MAESPLPPDQLREDVRLLGALVGDVLREQHGDEFLQLVEGIRTLAQQAREGDASAPQKLKSRCTGLEVPMQERMVRAFATYFSAVNMGEQIHRIRRRRHYEREGPQPHGPVAVFEQLKDEGLDADAVEAALRGLTIEPVFTAHPTESMRRSLLTKQQRIARALVDRIEPGALTPVEERRAWDRIREELTAGWQTEEHFPTRLTLTDEREHILFYLSRVIYRIIPSFYEALEAAFEQVFERTLEAPPLLHFSSWVGGDMDGNPNVNAETIEHTLQHHRDEILRLYRAEASSLIDLLSQSESHVEFSANLRKRLRELVTEFKHQADAVPLRHRDMPYRVFLTCVAAKLDETLRDSRARYVDADELAADIRLVAESLEQNRGVHAGLHHVRRFLRRVETFGFHFAGLDVRQDSEVHRAVLGDMLGVENYPGLGGTERLELLKRGWSEPPAEIEHPHTAPTLAVFEALKRARRTHGERAIGPYIISMAQGPDDVLAVLYLARQANFVYDNGVPLDIAPLFETVDDLNNAPATLRSILEDPLYREHLEQRGNVQQVMLGYSDSGKDSGIAAARQALYTAQQELVRVADDAGVGLVLFHGRGGSVSRGGSRITQALPAQPPGSVRGHLRVTEQGEIIHAKYGLRGIAQRTLEVMTGAVLKFSIDEGKAGQAPEHAHEVFRVIAEASREQYRALVGTPELIRYFRAATPIDVIERLRIGSRPPSRRKQEGVQDLRAIPWVFAWTQSRHVLPGWFGTGAGLEAAVDQFGLKTVREVAAWPPLRALLSDVEMVMAKADLGIAARYAELAEPADREVFTAIRAAYDSLKALLLEVLEADELLARETWLRNAIRLRNPYIDPMSLTQIELLQRWRAGHREEDALLRALFTTVKGIARGLQNTG
jgi:phosphoenolpyruvate carboxylase